MTDTKASGNGATMDMGSMQGGKAPPDARNSDDYADGYRNSTLPGYEMADKLSIPKILVDELEFTSGNEGQRSEEHTSELQSLMRISYAVFCLKKKKQQNEHNASKTYKKTNQ